MRHPESSTEITWHTGKVMKHVGRRFWIAWAIMLILMAVGCMSQNWCEDTALLGAAYALSLLATWLCHKKSTHVAFVCLIIMIFYNVILGYNLIFNSRYGVGLLWWILSVILNTTFSIALIAYYIIASANRRSTT